ncbi:MAG: class I SAM-dependent methyltransferase [Saprospiraceae bacterium]|nr:class I SAM-dependent methyltransferase [Saprospiraceae bacterium]
MEFKKTIYDHYISSHTGVLYGKESLSRIQKQFPVWRYYYGKLLPENKAASILDIGCGSGGFVWFLMQTGYKSVEGIDISAEQIAEGKAMGIESIQCADLRTFLANKPGQYDCIIARDVMEHFTKQEVFDILQLVHTSLKPGGCFIIQSPNGEGLFHTSIFYGDFTHEIAFTRSSLNQICRSIGFNNVRCQPTGPVPKGIKSGMRWALWQLVVLNIRLLKTIETGSGSGIFTQNLIAVAIKS